MPDHLIIGSGFAALKAAETIRQLDAVAHITLVTEENDPPYWRPRLPDVIAKQVTEDKVQMKPRAYFAEKKIDLRLGARVVKVLPLENRLLLSDGSSAGYDTLLLASGSLARRPGRDVPGSDLSGVVALRTLADARDIANKLDAAQQTAVVGGGLLGIELVRAFRERGNAVTYFRKDDRFWPQMLDATAARLVEAKLLERGIALCHQEVIREIKGQEGRVAGLVTTKGRELPCQVVGYAIGVTAATGFLAESGHPRPKTGSSIGPYRKYGPQSSPILASRLSRPPPKS